MIFCTKILLFIIANIPHLQFSSFSDEFFFKNENIKRMRA